MSTAVCASCGASHGPAQRYCLTCGALVGRRPVELDQAITYRHQRDTAHATAPASAATTAPLAAVPSTAIEEPASTADVSVWRRPVTSIATALALAAGITVGFLTAPKGGVADGGAPVVANGRTGTDATPPTAATPAGDAPATDAPAADAPEPATAPDDEQAADVAAPGPDDAAPPVLDVPAPVASPTPAAPTPAEAAAKPKPKPKAGTSSAKRTTTTPSTSKLPKVDHVWVIGVGTPVTARDGGYLGETLLERGTELPKYAPVSTDPLIGAAALVAGREPSASAKTIADRLTAAERPWRAYAPGTPGCDPASPSGIPLLAFPTVTSTAGCGERIGGLADLTGDLDAPPAFSYVATDPTLDADGLDAQLRQIVEPIRTSAAFKRAGLIAIVPTSADPIRATGALVLSPFAERSTAVSTKLGPYSLLRTFADLLGVKRPGHAADEDVAGLGPDVLARG